VLPDLQVDEFAAIRLEAFERAFLIRSLGRNVIVI
jgi:hypothetical protein